MNDFARRLLNWFQQHGRHDLPWQKNRTPYRVWVSEIMLQQTQVATVIPYYNSFMKRFPSLASLAEASQDDVLLHWAGLGYYSRARNLHKAAMVIRNQHKGRFPVQFEDVLALPGIGRSTAGAILAQSKGQRHAILDGNVKRVLARHRCVEGWYGNRQVEDTLWQWAEVFTPEEDIVDYTQAIMDLGATVCTRSSPACRDCPISVDCEALRHGRVNELPHKKPKKALPVKARRFLILRDSNGNILLEKRLPSGIWGGMWSLPELGLEQDPVEIASQKWQLSINRYKDLPVYRHTFSHYHLDITPCELAVEGATWVADDGAFQWHHDLSALAIATPVSAILKGLKTTK